MNHMTEGSALLQRFAGADACAARLLCDDHPADDVAFTVVEPDLSARELTYGEIGRESARFAAALADLGIGRGDRVAVLMSRSIELIVTLVGIWRRGAVLVPLSTALGRPAIATRLRAADVALVVVDADRRTKLAAGEGVPADPRWRVVVVRGEPGRRELSFEALMALYLDDSLLVPVTVGGDGPLALVFTAGTTGPPKAIAVPVRALAAFAAACLVDDDRPGDVHWDTADPGWATGLYSAVLGPLATGRRSLVTRGSIAPAPAWGLLARYRVTHLHAARRTSGRWPRRGRRRPGSHCATRRRQASRCPRTSSPGPRRCSAIRCTTGTGRPSWAPCWSTTPDAGPARWADPCPGGASPCCTTTVTSPPHPGPSDGSRSTGPAR
jgi:acetyl-CoA synthetase